VRHQLLGMLRISVVAVGLFLFPALSEAHVTLRPNQPLRPGSFADFIMNVPSERASGTVSVSLEVPEAFLKAGGRLNRVEYLPGWEVVIEKEDKPDEVYSEEMATREERGHASEGGASSGKTATSEKENELLNEMRRKWIKKVTFRGGLIPPDGFQAFLLSFQLPSTPGTYRFPAVQVYADGTEISWVELVQGAQHPAPSIILDNRQEHSASQQLPLVLSALALLMAAGLAVDRFRRGKA